MLAILALIIINQLFQIKVIGADTIAKQRERERERERES